MNGENINPKIDFVFRRLFGSEENKDLLISLINSVVDAELQTEDLVIKNPFNLAAYSEEKESILDIKARAVDGTWFNVEMQLSSHPLYGSRAVYYLANMYADQLQPGDDYSRLNKTIGIHFLDFLFFPGDDRFIRHFVFKDSETNESPAALDCMRLYFIEMPKFNKDWPEIQTALDRWVAFLNRAKDLGKSSLLEMLRIEPAIAKAVSVLDRIGSDPTERRIYEGEVKKRMVDQIQLRDAEERGMQQGMQQGMRQLLLDQMSMRIGEVPSAVLAKLNNLSATELHDFGLALFDLSSYADIERWLTRH